MTSLEVFLVLWAGWPCVWDLVFVVRVMATRRALHFVFKVGNRFQTVHFFRDVLGMQVQTGAERDWHETPTRGRAAPGEGGRHQPPGPSAGVFSFCESPLSGWEAFERGLSYQICCLRTFTYSPSQIFVTLLAWGACSLSFTTERSPGLKRLGVISKFQLPSGLRI